MSVLVSYVEFVQEASCCLLLESRGTSWRFVMVAWVLAFQQ